MSRPGRSDHPARRAYDPAGPLLFLEGVPVTPTDPKPAEPEKPKWWEFLLAWAVMGGWLWLPLSAAGGLLGWWLWSLWAAR